MLCLVRAKIFSYELKFDLIRRFEVVMEGVPLSACSPLVRDDILNERNVIVDVSEKQHRRWDRLDPLLFRGTYGDYLRKKISRVFPQLYRQEIVHGTVNAH